MAQPTFLSSLRSRLRSPQAQAPPPPPLPHLQTPRRGFHVELSAREKSLLEEDTALKRFKSYKKSVKRVSKVGDFLSFAVLSACLYEIVALDVISKRKMH
uniref:Succinate dehydrogenase subunit 7, mitochondrial n=1 Tax=Leersia perrieri TaxID=77586 RepID=A0A0D9XDB4_9ORYZ